MKRFLFGIILLAGCVQNPGPDISRRATPPPPPPVNLPRLDELALTSTPAGATARLSTGESCVTPCKIRKSTSSSPFSVTFEKENYAPQTIPVINNLEAIRRFNQKQGKRRHELDSLRVSELSFVPNPVSIVLEPAWSK